MVRKTHGVGGPAWPTQRMMNHTRFFLGLCTLAASVVSVFGQDASAILAASAKVYAKASSYAAQIDSRTVHLMIAPEAEGRPVQFEVQGSEYRQLQLRVKRPQAYWLATQRSSEGSVSSSYDGSVPDSTWAVLARTDNGQARQGGYTGTRYIVRDIDSESFNRTAASRLGRGLMTDPVLRHFTADGVMPESTIPCGLIEPDFIGRETVDGRPLYRLAAKTMAGEPVMVWIDEQSSLIVRTILQRASPFSRMPSASGASRSVVVVETFYKNQQTPAALMSSHFQLNAPYGSDALGGLKQGFGSVADLVKFAGLSASSAPASPGSETAAPPVPPEPTPAVASSPTAGAEPGQALTYEQMSGIVLIESDGGGTATGFMTKIRDVDFVVTNLHVLVGSKKISIKTLRGEEIPIQGIFGAAGGDVAIIRIPKGEGELRLAADVFQTSKIGDKVVVVGNRRGGGVATQTNGSIKGIGPKLIEVDANFQPGNSGSPIVNLTTNEVVGVATYTETRTVEVETTTRPRPGYPRAAVAPAEVEKRWFGFRLDGITKWEAIDLTRWNSQSERIAKFRETSEALVAVIKLDFSRARQHPRLTTIIDNFESRYRAAGSSSVNTASEVKDLFRVIRTVSEDGVRELTTGDYYDYYRTCDYWETSIPSQLDYRKRIVEVLKKYEANSSLYLSRMRGGN